MKIIDFWLFNFFRLNRNAVMLLILWKKNWLTFIYVFIYLFICTLKNVWVVDKWLDFNLFIYLKIYLGFLTNGHILCYLIIYLHISLKIDMSC